MSLGAKDVSPFVRVDRVIGVKQEVEVLDCLGEEEALLAVLETLVVHIVNSGVTTSANYHENKYQVSFRAHSYFAFVWLLRLCKMSLPT